MQCIKVSRLRRVDSLNAIFCTGDENSGYTTIRGMLYMQTWIKYRLQEIRLPPPLCGQLVYMITKYLIPRLVLCTTMEDVVQKIYKTPMARLLPDAFRNLDSRLSAVQQILDGNLTLPQEHPDMENLLEDI